MKTVCFVIQKGGTGKTSLAGNIAHIAAKQKKTLLIDGDPQGSVTSWFITESPKYELADVIQGRAGLGDTIVQLTPSLWLLPTFGIGGDLKTFAENGLENSPYCFEDLKDAAANMSFEFLVFDVSPGLGRLERMIMLASDELVVPVSLEAFGLDGLEIFTDFINETRQRYRKPMRWEKIVLNQVNRSFSRHLLYREKVQNLGYQIFEIAQDARIPAAQILHKSLLEVDPHAKSIPEFERLTSALTAV